jgi:uncharacterized protein YidB (DUF937 family)
MALMDLLEGQLSNAMGSTPHRGLLEAATAMLTNSQQGGLSGFVQHLTANGLGNAVASWVGNGPNQSVSVRRVKVSVSSG